MIKKLDFTFRTAGAVIKNGGKRDDQVKKQAR